MSGGTTAAIVGAGVLGAGASIIGSKTQASAMKSASATQAASLQDQLQLQEQALQQQQDQYTKNLAVEQPFVDAGTGALTKYTGLLNGSPDAQLGALEQTPGYQFEKEQGEQAITNGMSATTGNLSSAENKALIQYNQGLAGTTYNSFMDRLGGLVTTGQDAAAGQVAAGNTNSSNQAAIVGNEANAVGAAGNNTSQLQVGEGGALASGYGGVASAGQGVANGLLLSSLVNGSGGGRAGALSSVANPNISGTSYMGV